MSAFSCPDARTHLELIRSLKQQFDSAFDSAVSSGDLAHIKQAQEHKIAFMKEAHLLRESIVKEHIILREQKKNKDFFGEHYSLERSPPLPKEISLERILAWREQGFELKYLPAICLIDIHKYVLSFKTEVLARNDIPNWKKKPSTLFGIMQSRESSKEAGSLPGAWILVDTRPKPIDDSGRQMYENDPLAPALAELNQKGIIKQASSDGKTLLLPESRFGLSPNELAQPDVRQAFANILHIDSDKIVLQSSLIFNILGNRDHPEWGETNASEWFSDAWRASGSQYQLFGGNSSGGGLSCVSAFANPRDAREDYIGFRFIGLFSS